MMKYAVLFVIVVLGNALSACAQAKFNISELVDVLLCSYNFAYDTNRPKAFVSVDGGLACYLDKNSPRPVVDNIRFSDISRWADICGHWERAIQCVQNKSLVSEDYAVAKLENRTAIFTTHLGEPSALASSIYHFPRRVCHNYQVKSELTKYMSTDLSCLKRSDHVEFYRCYERLDCELFYFGFNLATLGLKLIETIEWLSAGALKCMRNVIETTACGTEAKELLSFISELQMPSIVDVANLNVTGAPNMNFGSDHRCTVGVYGDPHLLYCDADQLETCSSPGEQVYLSNSYMDIRGTNVELSYWKTPKPTIVRKIEITFKSADGKSHITTYTADNSKFPETFENGKTFIGQGYDQVHIRAVSAYMDVVHVTFIQSSMGAMLTLRRWRNNYSFALRMSSSVAKESHGLLGNGCPPSQIINRNANQPGLRLRRAAVTQEQCDNVCESMVSETMMVAACKYDCLIMNDLESVNMSAAAAADLREVSNRDLELKESARIYEKSRKPTTTPDKPMTTSDNAMTMPDKPTATSDKPTTSPDKPTTTTPDKLTTSPDKPTTTPDKLTTSLDKSTTTPVSTGTGIEAFWALIMRFFRHYFD